MMSQVDAEGHSYSILSAIIDHCSDGNALSKDDAYISTKTGKPKLRQTNRGWDLQVEWKDGTTSWIPLEDLKESNPVQFSEYTITNKISEEPAFAWWVRHLIRRRDRILKKVKSHYWRKTHNFGLELPKSVKAAMEIDRKNRTYFWRLSIEKEMKNFMPAFEFRNDDKMSIGYKEIGCHMIFDVKMELTRKSRLVSGGHKTDPPKDSTYASVV